MIAGLEEISGGILDMNEKLGITFPEGPKLIDGFPKLCLISSFISRAEYSIWLKSKKSGQSGRQRRLQEAAEMMGLTNC